MRRAWIRLVEAGMNVSETLVVLLVRIEVLDLRPEFISDWSPVLTNAEGSVSICTSSFGNR